LLKLVRRHLGEGEEGKEERGAGAQISPGEQKKKKNSSKKEPGQREGRERAALSLRGVPPPRVRMSAAILS
jgi:hypothetical protein